MANVGKNIKKLRTAQKMTQDQLAERLFVSRQTVSHYEIGKSNPDIDMLVKIAEVFETDVNTLIYGPPVEPNRKRQKCRIWILSGVTLLLGILTVLGTAKAKELMRTEFLAAPEMLMSYFAWPAFMLLLGWSVMAGAGYVWSAKRLTGKWVPWLWRGVLGLLAVYLVAFGPYLLDMVQLWIEQLRAGELISGSYSYGNWLFNPIFGFAARHMQAFRLCFFLLGVVGWLTGKEA